MEITYKVSIIVPVYNTEPYLDRCMQTLLKQSLKEVQIILVDDGSKDRSGILAEQYAHQDSRVLVIHKENEGLGKARNTGLEKAEGEYVGFVDSDDYVDIHMFEKMYHEAKKQDADIVLSGLWKVGGSVFKEKEAVLENGFKNKECFRTKTDLDRLLLGIVGAAPEEKADSRYNFSVCKNLFRNHSIQKNNLRFCSEKNIISEDLIFLIEFINSIQTAVGIPEAYYYYCRNESSLTRVYRQDKYEENKKLYYAVKKKLLERMPEKDFEIYIDRQLQAAARVAISEEVMSSKANALSAKELRQRILAICDDQELQAVLKRYPWYRLPKKQALFAFAMLHRFVWFQRILISLRKGW